MLSAFKSIYDYLYRLINNKIVTAGIVLVAGLAVGAFGFSSVVDKLYPIIGVIGFVYILFNLIYCFKRRIKRKASITARRVKRAVKRRV